MDVYFIYLFGASLLALAVALIGFFISEEPAPGEPPYVGAKFFPEFWHMVGFLRYGNRYFEVMVANSGQPIFTAYVFRRVYVVSDTEIAASVFRHSSSLSFQAFVMTQLAKMVGIPESVSALTNPTGDPLWSGVRAKAREDHVILRPTRSPDMYLAGQARLKTCLQETVAPELTTDLKTWLVPMLASVGITALYGPENPLVMDDNIYRWVQEFDESAMYLQVPWLRKFCKATSAVEKVTRLCRQYYERGLHNQASEFIQSRVDYSERHWGLEPMTKMDVFLISNFTGGFNLLALWLICFIYSDPTLLQDLRCEMERGGFVQVQDDHLVLRVNSAEILNKIPLLHSVWLETLRMTSNGSATRLVLEDTRLHTGHLLKKGGLVFCNGGAMHKSRKIWGEDVDRFDPRRFLNHQRGMSGKGRKGLLPFGGGQSWCPGRHLIQDMLVGLVVTLVVGYNIEEKGKGRIDCPDVVHTRTTRLIKEPSRSIVAVIRRRAGYEDMEVKTEVPVLQNGGEQEDELVAGSEKMATERDISKQADVTVALYHLTSTIHAHPVTTSSLGVDENVYEPIYHGSTVPLTTGEEKQSTEGSQSRSTSNFINLKSDDFIVLPEDLEQATAEAFNYRHFLSYRRESYAGLLPVWGEPAEEEGLFFWFFPSENEEYRNQKDIVIVLNGGPGGASTLLTTQPFGPIEILPQSASDEDKEDAKPWSWTRLTNVVFIDLPVGVGYSTGNWSTVENEFDVFQDFLGFWKNFVDLFELQGYNIYIAGFSYAGMYGSYIASGLLAYQEASPEWEPYTNMQGMLLYNALIGHIMTQRAAPLAKAVERLRPLMPLENEQRDFLAETTAGWTSFAEKYLSFPPAGHQPWNDSQIDLPSSMAEQNEISNGLLMVVYAGMMSVNPCFSPMDVSTRCVGEDETLWLNSFSMELARDLIIYNNGRVQDVLNMPSQIQEAFDPLAFDILENDDVPPPNLGCLPAVIDHTKNVILVQGALDLTIPLEGTLLSIQNMTFGGELGFQNVPSEPFYVPYFDDTVLRGGGSRGVIGTAHTERGLSFVGIDLVGHNSASTAAASWRQLEVLLGRVPSLSSTEQFSAYPFEQPDGEIGCGTLYLPFVGHA